MARQQQVYADFSGGVNDSAAAISIKDNEVCASENADYSAEIKSFSTRKGCEKFNEESYEAEITDIHIWSVGSIHKKCIVKDSTLYDVAENGTLTMKISLTPGSEKIYPFVMFNKFYFGDGNELYVWGDYDISSEVGTGYVSEGTIVRNNNSNVGGSQLGHFYISLQTRGSIDLSLEDYSNTSRWTDITEAPSFASSNVRKVKATDPSQPEKVNVTVLNAAAAAGTISINLGIDEFNTHSFSASVSSGDSVSDILTALKTAIDTDDQGWTCEIQGNSLICTRTTNGICQNGFVDYGTTGAITTYITMQNGKANDNNIESIKKCTMFIVHTASYRVFASGNPDDNAVFYSEIGDPAYFISDINKVYALNSYGKPTGMLQLSDSVLISFENGWYAWDGITPLSDATWKQLNIPYGCVSHRSIALTPYSFVYLSKDGIYNVSASILSAQIFLVQGRSVIEKVTKSKVDNVMSSIYDKSKCEGIFYDNVYYLAYNTAAGSGNDKVLKFEWDTQSFTSITGWKVNAWATDNTDLMFASTNYILITGRGYNDIDVETGEPKPINFYVKTKEYSFGNPFVNKVANLIGLIFKQPADEDMDIYADIRVITGYTHYDVNSMNITESLVWGRTWEHLWGFREAITKMIEFTFSSNTFQIEIRNNQLNSPITLIAIGFIYEMTDFVNPTDYKDEVLLM